MKNLVLAALCYIAVDCMLGAPDQIYAADLFCSDVTCLAAAINESNATPEDDRIFLQAETFTLQTPLPVITEISGGGRLEIIGSLTGLPSTIEREPQAAPFSIFRVATLAGLTLTNITVKGGDPEGIRNLIGRVSLSSVTLTGNRTGLVNAGGGADIQFTTISSNGLGIFNHDGTMSLFEVLFERNQNILAENGASEFRNATFRDNEGGISQDFPDLGGKLVLINSTFVRNRGSIVTDGPTIIENTTVAFNEAQGENAAVSCRQCRLTILNSTIVANHGRTAGGISRLFSQFSLGTVEIQNSVITGNSADEGSNADCDARGFPENVRSLGNNILGACNLLQHPSDRFDDPGLAAFVEDDNPGRSHFPLLATSLAINAANPTACPETDQLGNPRVDNCDIGAIEFQPAPAALTLAVDIRPGSPNNNINPNSNAMIPVAILSTDSFDVTTIDAATLRFGPNQKAADGKDRFRDVNRDGLFDLILHFRVRDTGIQCGDTSVSITGQTVNGIPIQGSDAINTVGCKANTGKKNS